MVVFDGLAVYRQGVGAGSADFLKVVVKAANSRHAGTEGDIDLDLSACIRENYIHMVLVLLLIETIADLESGRRPGVFNSFTWSSIDHLEPIHPVFIEGFLKSYKRMERLDLSQTTMMLNSTIDLYFQVIEVRNSNTFRVDSDVALIYSLIWPDLPHPVS